MDVSMYACMHVSTHVCIYAFMYVRNYLCMYASKRERGREEREEMRDRGREDQKMEALKWRDRHRKMQRGTEGERKR